MGLSVSGETLYLSSLYQLWRFENSLLEGQTFNGYDRVYVPQLAWTTGDIDIHDIAVDKAGRPIFVNTLFSCLATVSERYSFRPVWSPPFITKLADTGISSKAIMGLAGHKQLRSTQSYIEIIKN